MIRCSECKSTDIQIKMWVDLNTNEPNGNVSEGETEDNWCKNCEAHTQFEDFQELSVLDKILLQKQLDSIEAEFIQHFEEYDIEDKWNAGYLAIGSIPELLSPCLDEDFIRWFYFFQGKYQGIKDLLDKLETI